MIFGIIGFGRFGQLWANALLPFGSVKIYDQSGPLLEKPLFSATLQEVVQSDMLFLLVPISEFETCCQEVQPFLKTSTLVLDCCSVKMHPVAIMRRIFSENQPIIATHPLFGPDSVRLSGGLQGHKIAVCLIQKAEAYQAQVQTIFTQMGLQILLTTPEEHDRQMANSQALVHFIARGLSALDLQPQEMATPDFQALLNINKRVVHDTWQLFLDMHRYNPYAYAMRNTLIHQFIQLQQEIHMITIDQPAMATEQKATPTLQELRAKINEIDASIIEQLAQRQAISKQVGLLKAKTGAQVLDSKREEELMQYYEKLSNQHHLDPEFIKALFKMIHAHSRQLQK